MARHPRARDVLLIVAVILFGLGFRLSGLAQWRGDPNEFFYQDEPLLTTPDGYYYLSLARDLVEDKYEAVDRFRAYPDFTPRPSPPSMMSVLAAGISSATSWSLLWVAVLMPPILGCLIAIPIFVMGKIFGGRLCGTVAAAIALTTPNYFIPTGLGIFDTECMNITWMTTLLMFCLVIGTAPAEKRLRYVVGLALSSVLFFWWWDQAPLAVASLTLIPLGLLFGFLYRPARREGTLVALLLGGVAVIGLLVQGREVVDLITHEIPTKLALLTKADTGEFPNVGSSIVELQTRSFGAFRSQITGHPLTFVLALAGVILLALRRPRQSVFLVVPFVMGLMSLFYAARLAPFSTPLFALGLGFLVSELWAARHRYRLAGVVVPALIVLLMIPGIFASNRIRPRPSASPELVDCLVFLEEKLPRDAVVWSWWDHGYALRYWTRRATINDGDGTINDGQRTIYTGLPFASKSSRLSANFAQFYVVRGVAGIEDLAQAMELGPHNCLDFLKGILALGPDKLDLFSRDLPSLSSLTTVQVPDWQTFFFPPDPPPTFLFLDPHLARTTYWWHWFGTWEGDEGQGTHVQYRPFSGLRMRDDMILGSEGLVLDTTKGMMKTFDTPPRGANPIAELMEFDGKDVESKSFKNSSNAVFEVYKPTRIGAVMDQSVRETVFNHLYLRHRGDLSRFTGFLLQAPTLVVYEVVGQ